MVYHVIYFQVDKEIQKLDRVLACLEAKIKDKTRVVMENLKDNVPNRKYRAQFMCLQSVLCILCLQKIIEMIKLLKNKASVRRLKK